MAENEDQYGFDIGKSFETFQRILKQSAPAAAASYGLIASILLFTFIGWYIDSYIDTSPIAILIGLAVGFVIGFYNLIKTMSTKKY